MNLTVTSILKRVLPLQGFRYQSALWVEDADRGGKGFIEVALAARRGAQACGGSCGRRAPGYDRPEKVRCWQFISLWALQIYLVYAPRRVDCRRYGVRVERLPWATGSCTYARPSAVGAALAVAGGGEAVSGAVARCLWSG